LFLQAIKPPEVSRRAVRHGNAARRPPYPRTL